MTELEYFDSKPKPEAYSNFGASQVRTVVLVHNVSVTTRTMGTFWVRKRVNCDVLRGDASKRARGGRGGKEIPE